MKRHIVVAALLLLLFALTAAAQNLTADEQAFINKQISQIVTTKATRLVEPELAKVFATPFYKIEVIIKEADDSTQTIALTTARVGDKLVTVNSPGTDSNLQSMLKMIAPAFKLKTDADATTLQKTLDILYPPFMDDEKKAIKFTHSGNTWTFIRGKFFDDNKGFVFQTDAAGTITSIKYELKLAP